MVFEFRRPTFLNKAWNCTPLETFLFVATLRDCSLCPRNSPVYALFADAPLFLSAIKKIDWTRFEAAHTLNGWYAVAVEVSRTTTHTSVAKLTLVFDNS